MPTYEYQCTACQNRFERFQKFSDPPVTECPECGGNVRKVLFPAGVVFKGSGWYITDSRKGGSSDDSSSSSTKTETKTETKSDSKSDGAASSSTSSGSSSKSESSSTSASKS